MPSLALVALAVVVGALVVILRRHGIAAGEPPVEIDIGAALRAERPPFRLGRLAANGAGAFGAAAGLVVIAHARQRSIASLDPRPKSCDLRTARSSRRVEPRQAHRIAVAGQEAHGLVEGQPDDVGIGADELDHEAAGKPLDGIAARLAAPLA